MNLKNVAHLIRVDIKSGRLVRGRKLTKFRERRLVKYIMYSGALVSGIAVGTLVGFLYNTVSAADPQMGTLFNQGLLNLFLSLPTLVMIYSLVFTMMQQMQRSGIKFSVQAPYWLPITWEEHTLASTVANLLGFPLVSIVFIGSTVIVLSLFIGQVANALLTLFTILASAFMASTFTEILRILQIRSIGAVYKSSGRAAVWIRFAGSLVFFILFYIFYFSITSGAGALSFIQGIASAQSAVWFVPFVWLGMTVYSFINGQLLNAIVFMTLSLLFILGLFYMAVILNRRFGLYEPPAITVSHGAYAPRTGFLSKLGFSKVEGALIRKDLRAFTRRRELIYIFVLPVVFILVPLLTAARESYLPTEGSLILLALILILPGAAMAVFMGNLMIGEEGNAIWRIYSAPISAKSLVKSKYFFIVFLSVLVTAVTGIVGVTIFHPTLRTGTIALVESLLMVLALGALSLANGIKGADFTELPRPRMIRTRWAIVNLIVCLAAALAILIPIVAYAISRILPFISVRPLIDLYPAIGTSAVIAGAIAFFAYKKALQNARELLVKAEM
jgi:hypothetical protein